MLRISLNAKEPKNQDKPERSARFVGPAPLPVLLFTDINSLNVEILKSKFTD
jgi:hypothetical protein